MISTVFLHGNGCHFNAEQIEVSLTQFRHGRSHFQYWYPESLGTHNTFAPAEGHKDGDGDGDDGDGDGDGDGDSGDVGCGNGIDKGHDFAALTRRHQEPQVKAMVYMTNCVW